MVHHRRRKKAHDARIMLLTADYGYRLIRPTIFRLDHVMPNYRRAFVDGGCWFFTVNLEDRRSRLLTEHIDALREAVAKVKRRQPFDVNAWVVLPDHMHAIWTLPPEDTDFPTRWRLIKAHFPSCCRPPNGAARCTRRETSARSGSAATGST
jgi:REP element-mobilizing transposase RayT